jgi:hypothetical protein
MVMVTRAFNHIHNLQLWAAIRVVAHIWSPRAYIMAMSWLLRRYYPRRFSSIERTIIWRNETEMATALDRH